MKKFIFFFAICIIFSILASACTKNLQKVKTVRLSTWGSVSEMEILKPIIRDFESKNPGTKVEILHIPQNYFQKLHLLFASNLAPDVIFLNNYYLKTYAKEGLLLDLSDVLQDKNQFFENSLHCLEYENKLYAAPRDVSNLVIYYNKTLFDKYKVDYPDNNWTFGEMLSAAKKLSRDTNGDGKTDVFGISAESAQLMYYLPYLFSDGGSVIDRHGRINITSNESVKSLQLYSDLINKYKVAPSKSDIASRTYAQLFLENSLAMHVSGRWLVPKYRKDAKFDWDITILPRGTIGSISPVDASGYAVAASSKNKQEAIRLMSFLTSKPSIASFSSEGLIVPARKDVAFSESFLYSNLPPSNAKAFIDSLNTGMPTPVSENYPQLMSYLNSALEPLFLGKTTAKELLNENFKKELEKVID